MMVRFKFGPLPCLETIMPGRVIKPFSKWSPAEYILDSLSKDKVSKSRNWRFTTRNFYVDLDSLIEEHEFIRFVACTIGDINGVMVFYVQLKNKRTESSFRTILPANRMVSIESVDAKTFNSKDYDIESGVFVSQGQRSKYIR